MKRVYNFSAGPSILPETVLKRAAAEMLDYEGSGQSVMEMSHRSKVFQGIIDSAESLLREVMNIPDNYKVLFLQGGASSQFAAIPLNLAVNSKKADYVLTGQVQTTPVVTDYLLSPGFALIISDEDFDQLVQDNYRSYLNAALDEDKYIDGNIFQTLEYVTNKIDSERTLIYEYESYMNNMGRQLFYLVATSYVTIYLALVFLVIANTILGVQFLMNQKKSSKRYKTLVKLGATHKIMCQSSSKQINWYFGIPIAVAAVSSFFGVRALFAGILSSRTKTSMSNLMISAAIVLIAFVLIECIYILVVKRASYKYLKTLMNPEREE